MSLSKTEAHQPFQFELSRARTAILFIHGILEGPYQFREFAEISLQQGHSAYAILLPGHGGSGEQFAKSNKGQWVGAIEKKIEQLEKKYDELIMVGHSMGALLSILSISHHPKIKKAFLIATPLKIRVNLQGVTVSLKAASGHINEQDPYLVAFYRIWSVRCAKPHTYLKWLPRYQDLFSLVHETRNILNQIQIPLGIAHSMKDEFVSDQSIDIFQNQLTCHYNILTLKKSGHFYYVPEEKQQLLNFFEEFIKQ